jgi:hypothetical protein
VAETANPETAKPLTEPDTPMSAAGS